MPIPLQHQWEGARFLSERDTALLADAPRVGKTGSAILAADDIFARNILVTTTSSGRAVWERAFRDWSMMGRTVEVLYGGALEPKHLKADVLIVSWAILHRDHAKLVSKAWDLLIADESHYAKSVETKRTIALYGKIDRYSRVPEGLVDAAARTWCLTGTPIPNAPDDLFPMMRALCPERLSAHNGWPDVSSYDSFLHRYCVTRSKRLSRWNTIPVVIGGRNLPELRQRLDGFWLRRTQQDVGITAPIYDLLPIHISPAERKRIERELPPEVRADEILEAAETGETKTLDMHSGTLRRATGRIKAAGVAQAVRDDLECGAEKIAVMTWHKDTLDVLEKALSQFNPVRIDGSTSADSRGDLEQRFQTDPTCRVFLGQIVACGEAIDLSAASELIFAESSFTPKDMSQAALRITNHGQKAQPRVRVAALSGSIDEALQAVLMRKIKVNKEVLRP